jgi:glycine dehydrogenase
LSLSPLPRCAFSADDVCGALVQYPNTHGVVSQFGDLPQRLHAGGALLVVAADLLSLTVLQPPGEFGADVVVGSAQRFGVPMGFGGPHAAFMAVAEEHKRKVWCFWVGISFFEVDERMHGSIAIMLFHMAFHCCPRF